MNRLLEPSTWAGISTLAGLATTFLPPAWQWIGQAVTAGAGAAAIKLREGGA